MPTITVLGEERTVETFDDWNDVCDTVLQMETVYTIHLRNGFSLELKWKSRSQFVDVRRTQYNMSFKDNDVMLYEKEQDSAKLTPLGSVERIEQ